MSFRRLALALIAATTLGSALIQGQVPGRNVNMVSGRTWPDGDPFLQRQNEPSIAASTRNPLHLLAGSNDYRTVDLPGLPDDNETGDAWLGLFKSFDGGSSWRSLLVPGYPQDTSVVGMASPLKGYEAAADPVVRAGTNGLFYYTSIVFNRGTGGKSALAVSRFIDNNNKEAGDPIAFVDTTLVATNDGAAFIDKPWFAVDIPRAGAAMCTFTAPDGSQQSFPGGTAYVVYSLISTVKNPATNLDETKSQLYMKTSNDCGATWGPTTPEKPYGTQISSTADDINQGATLAIDPRTGIVYVAWRRFSTAGSNDAIMVTRSFDRGRTWDIAQRVRQFLQNRPGASAFLTWLEAFWQQPLQLADLSSLDQPTAPDRFRSNAYPTMTVDADSRVHVAWAERGFGKQRPNPDTGDARVVISTSSTLGFFWTEPRVVDDPMTPTFGHQLMPSLSFAGGKLMLAYYDLREDVSGVFGEWIDETSAFTVPRRHTVDIRAAQAVPATRPVFAPSVRVSEYVQGVRPGSAGLVQFQFNPPNFQLFGLGTVPFIGDYIDLAPSPSFVPAGRGKWAFNTATSSSPLFHVVWTDNRDVRPPRTAGAGLDGLDWTTYTPPNYLPGLTRPDLEHEVPVCVAGNEGMRNQNIYTARITGGLVAGSPGNVKPLDPTMPRAFVVFAQNATDVTRRFRLAITNQPPGGRASFQQTGLLPSVDVVAPARSTVARNVYVTSTDPDAQINVTVTEIGSNGTPTTNGLRSTVVLNPDISNPDISNPDISNPDISNPDISNAEVYNPDISNPDISNPDISNPDISNPDISNPDISNVVVANPDISNPDISNPDISNPDISNPDISNPDISNTAPGEGDDGLTDTTWTVTNNGNTTTSYDVQLLLNGPGVPAGIKLQLVLHKLYTTPVAVDCELKTQTQNVLLANIRNPTLLTGPNQIGDPTLSNGSLWVAPGETAKITLRVYDPVKADGVTFNPVTQITPVVVSQAINTPDLGNPAARPPLATPPLANGQVAVVEFANPGASLGRVVVTVVDNQGAVVPGANVRLSLAQLDGSTGVLEGPGVVDGGINAVTDEAGRATFNSLTISENGRYRLRATIGAPGLNFTILSGVIVVSTPTAVQWSADVEGNGHYYEYVRRSGLSWDTANAEAQARTFGGLTGHLVTITNGRENQFVNALRSGGDMRAWIGLVDTSQDPETFSFSWITGEPVTFTNWCLAEVCSEPNNRGIERWVEMFGDGTWNNNVQQDPIAAYRSLGYIVEYEPAAQEEEPGPPAGTTLYRNKSDFVAALSNPTTIDFDNLTAGSTLAGDEFGNQGVQIANLDGHPVHVGTWIDGINLTIPSKPNAISSSYASVPAPGFSPTAHPGVYFNNAASDRILFTFTTQVSAAGIHLGENDYQGLTLTWYGPAGNVVRTDTFGQNNPGNGFVGLVSPDAPIVSLQVFNAANDGDGVFFDDLVFQPAGGTAPLTYNLQFLQQPQTANVSTPLANAPTVRATDASGAIISGAAITVSVANNPGGSTLDGVKTATTNQTGVAAFPGLSLNRAATGYTLRAASGDITTTSAAFNITGALTLDFERYLDGTGTCNGCSLSNEYNSAGVSFGFTPSTPDPPAGAYNAQLTAISGSNPPESQRNHSVTAPPMDGGGNYAGVMSLSFPGNPKTVSFVVRGNELLFQGGNLYGGYNSNESTIGGSQIRRQTLRTYVSNPQAANYTSREEVVTITSDSGIFDISVQMTGGILFIDDLQIGLQSQTDNGLPGNDTRVADINDQGAIVGWSRVLGPGDNPNGPHHAYMDRFGQRIDMHELLPGFAWGNNSRALGINYEGKVVGEYDKTADADGGQPDAAFFFDGIDKIVALPGPAPLYPTGSPVPVVLRATAINDSSVIVGNVSGGNTGNTRLIRWTPIAPTPSGDPDFAYQEIFCLGAQCYAEDLNEGGQIVGRMSLPYPANQGQGDHAFVWNPNPDAPGGGTMHDLGTLGGTWSYALAINDLGQVVGHSQTADGKEHAFLWNPTTPNSTTGTMIDLGTLGGANSTASAINNAGEVVGHSNTPGPFGLSAFLYTGGVMVDLGAHTNGVALSGTAINNTGTIAGWAGSMEMFIIRR